MKYMFTVSRIMIVVLMFSAVSSCDSKASNEAKPVAETAPSALEVIQLQEDSFSTSIRIPGELTAYQQVDLYAKVNSFVKALYVDAGTEVTAGQLLATLEAPEINSQLAAAASRLKSQEAVFTASKATYNRLLETSKTPGTISPNDLDLAYARQQSDEASLQAARAQYDEIINNRNYLQVRAPFNGVISARNISTGAYVGPAGRGSERPMFTLVEQKKLRLVVSVPENYTSYLSNKTEIKFMLRSMPRDTFEAKLSRQAGALDTRLRSERVEMDVVNNGKKLLPGMVAEVLIPLATGKRSFVVPSSAVLNSTTGVFVIRIRDKKSTWIPVTASRTFEGKTEISGDLSANDTLVKLASEEVRDGAPVGAVKLNQ